MHWRKEEIKSNCGPHGQSLLDHQDMRRREEKNRENGRSEKRKKEATRGTNEKGEGEGVTLWKQRQVTIRRLKNPCPIY